MQQQWWQHDQGQSAGGGGITLLQAKLACISESGTHCLQVGLHVVQQRPLGISSATSLDLALPFTPKPCCSSVCGMNRVSERVGTVRLSLPDTHSYHLQQ
jgi:hypothetical protein